MIQFIINQISKFRLLFYNYKIFKTHSFEVPIISVGNIESGGTGKTPMVSWLSKILESKNKKVCVVSRGYGRQSNQTIVVDHNKQYTVNEVGDEPFMLLKENPNLYMVVGHNKIKSIQLAIDKLNVDIIILDDGFQSIYIKRDLDIVMININNFSNNINREPLSSLSRADIVIFKPDWAKARIKSKIMKKISENMIPSIQAYSSIYITDEDNTLVNNISEPVIGVCGIADPISFENTLATKNINVVKCLSYSDHYIYTNNDMINIKQTMVQNNIKSIITTTKDYYKIKTINKNNIKIYILKIEFDFQDNLKWDQSRVSEVNKLDDKNILLKKINTVLSYGS